MPEFRIQPPLPRNAAGGAFIQTIEPLLDSRPIGLARWYAPPDPAQGVVQILEMTIWPDHRRRGHGRRLLQAAIEQASRYHRLHRVSLRQAWIAVEQKSQVIARAFLTECGFHHVSTINGLLRDQDMLIYLRSMD